MQEKKHEIAKKENLDNISPSEIKSAAWMALSEESQKAYESDFNLFFNFIQKNPKEIMASDVMKYINHLQDNGYQNSSINRKIASLSKMFNIMMLAKEIDSNPISVLKNLKNISYKVSKEIKMPITIKDIKKVVKISGSSTFKEQQMSLIIKFLAGTGLRISEFINIKYSDMSEYDENNKLIRIIGKGKKERFIYLDNDFLKEIQEIFTEKSDMPYLFYNQQNKKYDRKSLWRDVKKIFREKINKDVHPHMLRHFFATYKIHNEKQDIKAVSKFLGHSDVSITLNAYVDTSLDVKSSKIKI